MRNDKNIKMVGVGSCGCNVINYMIEQFSQSTFYDEYLGTLATGNNANVTFYAVDNVQEPTKTKAQAVHIDVDITADINKIIEGADLIYLIAGMGGNTGTHYTVEIAQTAKKLAIPTIVFVIEPFAFEGKIRNERTEQGIKKLLLDVDALIVLSNEKALKISQNTKFSEAFSYINHLLYRSINMMLSNDILRSEISVIIEQMTSSLSQEITITFGHIYDKNAVGEMQVIVLGNDVK